jgi:hypothetical protein
MTWKIGKQQQAAIREADGAYVREVNGKWHYLSPPGSSSESIQKAMEAYKRGPITSLEDAIAFVDKHFVYEPGVSSVQPEVEEVL